MSRLLDLYRVQSSTLQKRSDRFVQRIRRVPSSSDQARRGYGFHIVMDDREMGRHLCLTDTVWIGGINIDCGLRGRGLGTILFESVDKHVQQVVRKNSTVGLSTNNSPAKKIYQQYGLRSHGCIQDNAHQTPDEYW